MQCVLADKAPKPNTLRPNLRSLEPLPHIKVGGGLINHVDVAGLGCYHSDGKALELPSYRQHMPCSRYQAQRTCDGSGVLTTHKSCVNLPPRHAASAALRNFASSKAWSSKSLVQHCSTGRAVFGMENLFVTWQTLGLQSQSALETSASVWQAMQCLQEEAQACIICFAACLRFS